MYARVRMPISPSRKFLTISVKNDNRESFVISRRDLREFSAGLSEMGGGILLTLGLLTPFGSAAVLSAMLVAIVSVHVKNGFFAMANGFELPFLYAASAVGLAFSGPGGYSFDSWLGLTFLNEGYLVEAILVLAVLGAAATLASRRQVEEQASAVRN